MFKTRFISILVLLCLTVSGAWAQEETLLTTIESTGDNASFVSGSETFDNIATVTFSGYVYNDGDEWGWYSEPERTLTVTAAEGYTITRVKFYTYSGSAFDEEAPFEAILVHVNGDNHIAKVNGTSIGQYGVNKIEVYGYAGTPASTYTVTLKEGTDDATSWTIAPPEATTTGVAQGTQVTATYTGTKKVKSVKAKKKASAAAYTMAAAATSADKGKLICADGHIHANGADAACTKARVAKIIYIGTTGHATYSHGLALALTDEGQMTWGAAMTACNTTKNTNTPVTDATWLLASKVQWNYMKGIDGAGSASALRTGFEDVSGTNMVVGEYWSSTVDEDDDYCVYALDFSNGWWGSLDIDGTTRYVRACLAF